jgi:hypothetical protein
LLFHNPLLLTALKSVQAIPFCGIANVRKHAGRTRIISDFVLLVP